MSNFSNFIVTYLNIGIFVTWRLFDNAMRAVANAIAILVAPLGVEREIIVCWIGAHGRSAVRRNWGGVNRLLHTWKR